MYMKHADVVSGIVGKSVGDATDSIRTLKLVDSSVYRKVGNDFYPWWVKLTYHYKNNPRVEVWNADTLVSGCEKLADIHGDSETEINNKKTRKEL